MPRHLTTFPEEARPKEGGLYANLIILLLTHQKPLGNWWEAIKPFGPKILEKSPYECTNSTVHIANSNR
jgi:hypothetical protein